MATKDQIRARRDGAFSAELGIGPQDKVKQTISRQDGLYIVSLDKIIRMSLPDDLDPEMEHENAPVTQSLIVEKGSREPIIARTILQGTDFARLLPNNEQQKRVENIAWEVMSSLLALDRVVGGLRASIEAKKVEIGQNYNKFITGSSPPPPPIIEGLEIEFRSAALIANHALNAISELFPTLFEGEFKRGAFDRLMRWATRTFGKDDILSKILEGDHRWINLWGEVRNAFEHPRDDYYVKINNFHLLPSREIQLPTWQFKHPKFPHMFRPQQLVGALEIHQANLLGFFENLLVVLTDKSIKPPVQIAFIDKKENDRDPECPKRYELQLLLPKFTAKK